MSATSSSRISLVGSPQRTTYLSGCLRTSLGYRLTPLDKEALSKFSFTDREQKEQAQQAVLKAIASALEGLREFVAYGDGAVRLSKRWYDKLPYSIFVLVDGSVYLQSNTIAGKGRVKLFKIALSIDSNLSYVVASPVSKKKKGIRDFDNAIQKCEPIHEKLSGLPGFPLCISSKVQNVCPSTGSRRLILERFSCNLMHLFYENLLLLTDSARQDLKKQIIKNLVDAVALMHEKNVVHLDLKINNILFNTDGKVGITDFDCAIDFDKPIPRDILAGAAAFCPPEVIQYCKTIEGLSEAEMFTYYCRKSYLNLLEKIEKERRVTVLGHEFSTRSIVEKTVYPRLLKQLAVRYDVYSLAICLITILTCETPSKYNWNDISSYRFEEFDSPFENGLMAIARGIVEAPYLQRPTMVDVQKLVVELFERTQ